MIKGSRLSKPICSSPGGQVDFIADLTATSKPTFSSHQVERQQTKTQT